MDSRPLDRLSRPTLWRAFLWPGWVPTALLATVWLAGVSAPPVVQYLPLAVSVVLFGLPHGAVDHRALAWADGRNPTPRSIARVVGLYLALGILYSALWFTTPAAALVLFIALTWFHWGQGDLHALVALAGADHLRTPGQRALTAVVRGGLPMLVPLLAFPDWYRRVVADIVGLFAPSAVAALSWAFRPRIRFGLAVVYGIVVVGTLALGYTRARDGRGWTLDAGETVLLTAYFAIVPPVLAIGVYFCLWHSVRHVGRLLLLDDRAVDALAAGDLTGSLARFARVAAPLTGLSLVTLVALYALVPRSPGDVSELVALYLVFIAVVTLPHVVVVSLMDREQGIWTAG